MSVRSGKQGPVTTVILSRPGRRNAVDAETARQLGAAFRAFEGDAEAKAEVFHGGHGAFRAGDDLKSLATGAGAPALQAQGDGAMGPTGMLLTKPVIAAVAGHAVAGGMELALWCDLRVMEEDAVMGVFCRRWGVPSSAGGTVPLAAPHWHGPCPRPHPYRPSGGRGGGARRRGPGRLGGGDQRGGGGRRTLRLGHRTPRRLRRDLAPPRGGRARWNRLRKRRRRLPLTATALIDYSPSLA